VASRHYRHDLLEEDFAIYAELLSDLDAKTLDAAYKQALKTCKFFPTAAEVLAHVERADSVAEELSAESAWARALKWCIANGNVPGTPRPIGEPAIEVAIRAAGGANYIEAANDEQRMWARKTFLDIYLKYRTAPNLAALGSTEQARAFLQEAAAEALALSGKDLRMPVLRD